MRIDVSAPRTTLRFQRAISNPSEHQLDGAPNGDGSLRQDTAPKAKGAAINLRYLAVDAAARPTGGRRATRPRIASPGVLQAVADHDQQRRRAAALVTLGTLIPSRRTAPMPMVRNVVRPARASTATVFRVA